MGSLASVCDSLPKVLKQFLWSLFCHVLPFRENEGQTPQKDFEVALIGCRGRDIAEDTGAA